MSLYKYGGLGSTKVDVYRITSSWDESTSTWSNKPASVDASITNSGSAPANNSWVEWDVTSIVSGWHSGAFANHGFELRNADAGTITAFSSSEAGANTPYLTITYEPLTIPEPLSIILSGIAGCMLWLRSSIKGKKRI